MNPNEQHRSGHVVIGVDTAAEILVVVGDNPERTMSEAALAKFAGIAPLATGSGMTSGRHRINHGGRRQLNAAIYRTVSSACSTTNPRSTTLPAAPPRARRNARSSAASNATSSARSTT
ncbi:transposase [Streptomyces sp. NPDC102467]|uniref:transposase n=1 Tax=Streptomyces sp. NPDC102467 TaxID=3366179 RepID=UPI0038104EEB